MLEFFLNYFDFFCYLFGLTILFALGYLFGSISSIKDDIKSLDYDRIVAENTLLKSTIDIKSKRQQ